jgi:apolipoprotein N-acyltransferase
VIQEAQVTRSLYVSLLAVLAGVVSALGFAPLELLPLTLLAVALLVECVARAERLWGAFGIGWLFGLGQFAVGLCWIPTAFTYQANMPASLGWFAEVLLSAYLALFPALACGLAWWLRRADRVGFVFVLAAAWMLAEWLRGVLLTGFPWNPLGVIWLPVPWISRLASLSGAYGLSSLAVVAAGLIGLGLRRGMTGRAVACAVLVWMLVSRAWMPSPRSATAHADPAGIPVRVVQPNIGQGEKYDQDERNAALYATLSGKPGPAPRLLLWPEGATLKFLDIQPKARANLAALLGPDDLLLLGGESVIPGATPSDDIYHNSVFALDHTGAILWRYDKAHLVPFGEYLPARSILGRLGLSRLVPGETDFMRGPGPRTFPLPGFPSRGAPATVGVQICYEIVFSGRVIDESHRPSFLFNPSNDAWFGAWGPPQHLAQARLRAIEEGVPVVRATPNGISAVVGPRGELIATVARQRAGVIDAVLPAPLPPTLFAKVGLWGCLLQGLILTAIGFTANRRPSRGRPPVPTEGL